MPIDVLFRLFPAGCCTGPFPKRIWIYVRFKQGCSIVLSLPWGRSPSNNGNTRTHRFHGQVAVQETSHLQYTGWTGSAQKLPQAPQPSQLVANPEPSFSDLRVLALKIKLIEALESTWPAPLAASPLRSPIARWKTSTTLGLTWAYIGRLGPCGPALEALEIRDRDRSYVLFCGTMPER